ncbi:MAG: 2-nitropropane dioxygenase [Thermoanaerobaculia bacterium]
MSENIEILCPDCDSTIVIDRDTGQILWHKAKEKSQKHNFDSMLSELKSQKDEMAKKFDREMESQKDRARLLEEKFKQAMQRADKSDKPMKNPLDLD